MARELLQEVSVRTGYKYMRYLKAMLYALMALVCFVIAERVHAGNVTDLNETLVVNRQAAELCLETASTLEEAFNYIDETDEINLMGNIKLLHDFSTALQKDIETSPAKGFTVLRSYTLEEIGKFGLGKMPGVVDVLKKTGKLPSSFNLPATFGAEEFARAVSMHIGSGKADIDTITNYLDGLNKGCWAVVGYMVGGPEAARVYQSIAGTGAKLLREATLPVFNKAVVAWRRQGEQLVNQWHTLQERRIYDGLPVQTIIEVYGEELLRKNGISKKDIQELDTVAYNLNQSLIQMKKDLSTEKIEEFKESGEIVLGGVYIDPEVMYVGRGGNEVKKNTIDSRPSEDILSWPVDISETEE
ncbi:MAG: hypothetical protein JRD93_00705 [Deltaproteobacteria bacterium]|nr:hypothetical protein [Deltaproteobacteria bacterium]